MKNIVKIIFVLFSSFSFLNAYDSEYYDMDEYFSKYDNEEKNFRDLKNIINKKSQKLKIKNIKPISIVMIYPGKQVSDYWRRSKTAFVKRMNELNISFILKDYFTKPGVEIKLQARQLSSAIKNDTDYLIFTLDANKHSKFIEQIIHKKKPKIILQNITTPLKKWSNKQALLYVGFDHKRGSQKLAAYYIKKTKGEGTYGVLYGTKGYVSLMRGKTFNNYINKNSNLKLTGEYYTFFNKNKAKIAALDLLERSPNIKFIYALGTDIALGALEAIKEKKLLGKVLINGWGGGSAELEKIKNKELDVTIMRMNDENSLAMAEVIKLDILKKDKKIPTIFSGTLKLIEKNINANILKNLEKEAFRYSNE